MKRKITSKLCCILLVLTMCIGMIPVSVGAQSDTLTYLALGDSITAGYGLDSASSDECFVTQLADEIGATNTVNAGKNGLTAAGLLTALTDTENENYYTYTAAVAAADVITLTIGGNDLMEVFYAFTVELAGENGITTDVDTVKSILADPTGENLQTALTLFNLLNKTDLSEAFTESDEFKAAVSNCVSNINKIAEIIKGVNPDAVILVANQYNPYQWLGSSYANIISLFEAGVVDFNEELSVNGSLDYTVADVYTAFADSEASLTNAEITVDMSSFPIISYSLDLDFHPNTAGHKVIAGVPASAYEDCEETVYTWEIPIELTVENAGSAEAPEQIFESEILDFNGDVIDTAESGITVAVNTVNTDGAGTYTAVLEFTGNDDVLSYLSDGFYVRLKAGTEAGWTYDDTEYSVYAYFDEAGEQTETEIYRADDEDTESALTAAAFICTYKGWTLSFETNGGEEIDSVEATDGTAIDISDYVPTRDGYTFIGWYSDEALTEPVTSVTLVEDTTVYADWEENEEDTVPVTTNTTAASDSPQTGDNIHTVLWLILMLIGCLGAAAAAVSGRKGKTN